MSELNRKKMGPILKFVVIYSIVMIIFTVTCMFLYQKTGKTFLELIEGLFINENDLEIEEEIVEEQIDKPDYSNIKRTDSKDKYYSNNITTTTEKITEGDIIEYDYWGEPSYKIEASYIQIAGLKNKNIENKINNEIKRTVEKIIEDEKKANPDYYSIRVFAEYVHSNSADLISISLSQVTRIGYEEYIHDNFNDSLNFRLDTGEKLKFEDLFTPDANIKLLITRAAYESCAWDYGVDAEDPSFGDMDKKDYGDIENSVYEIVSHYNKYGIDRFFFYDMSIMPVIDGRAYSIPIVDNINYINMYNIVETDESLYENGNREKVNYVGASPYFSYTEYNSKIDENSYLVISNPALDIYSAGYNDMSTEIAMNLENIIDTIKNDNKEKENKGYIYHLYGSYENTTTGELVFNGTKVEFDYDDFDERQEEIFFHVAHEFTGEMMLYFESIHGEKEFEDCNIYWIEINNKNPEGVLRVGEKFIDANYNVPDEYTY